MLDEKATERRLVCTAGNPYGLPAKDRSGRLDMTEPPDLGRLLAKINTTRDALRSTARSRHRLTGPATGEHRCTILTTPSRRWRPSASYPRRHLRPGRDDHSPRRTERRDPGR